MMTAPSPYASAFADFGGRVWLNAAHQGPLPVTAAEAAHEAIAEKLSPQRISEESFQRVPQRLREAIGRLIGASPDDVILGNSTSYGLDLVAHATAWRPSDEIVVVEGDFPAAILPWLPLRQQGVVVRFVPPSTTGPTADEIAKHFTGSTRLFCASWVNSFTGVAIDVDAIANACRAANVMFVVNASQALGARTLDVARTPIDVVTCCGHKWLCGPYGTGFCWIRPSLRASLTPPHVYWLAMQAGRSLDTMRTYAIRDDLGARAFDVFGTANFFNFKAWTAAIEWFLSANPAEIAAYDQQLVGHFLDRLDRDRWVVTSPAEGPARSTLVIIEDRSGRDVRTIQRTLAAGGVDVAVREGRLRISPHAYNSTADLDRAAEVVNEAAAR